MDRVFKLVAAATFFLASAANAAYSNGSPPEGSKTILQQLTQKATITSKWDDVMELKDSVKYNVGGRSVAVPATLRATTTAGQWMLRGIAAGSYVGWGLAAFAAYQEVKDWFDESGVKYEGGKWKVSDSAGDFLYQNPYESTYYSSPEQACEGMRQKVYSDAAGYNFTSSVSGNMCSMIRSDGSTHSQYVLGVTPNTNPTTSWRDADFEKDVLPKMVALPPSVPNATGLPVPVQTPSINPDASGTPQPYDVPTGAPQAVPGTSPQQYQQPGVTITPSPTPLAPWLSSIDPKTWTTTDPKGITEGSSTTNNNTTTSSSNRTEIKDQDPLCETYPDILACQNLDEPDDQDLDQEEKQISLSVDTGWGATNAACPAPRVIMASGHRIEIPFDLFCRFMEGIRPVIIAMAWLAAAFIVIGFKQGE